MRRLSLIALLLLSCSAMADTQTAKPAPAEVPEPPALPAGVSDDPSFEPEVTITEQKGEKHEEYKIHGRVYMIKVTPKSGKPYYLVDEKGDGRFSRQESTDSGIRVPLWVIHSF